MFITRQNRIIWKTTTENYDLTSWHSFYESRDLLSTNRFRQNQVRQTVLVDRLNLILNPDPFWTWLLKVHIWQLFRRFENKIVHSSKRLMEVRHWEVPLIIYVRLSVTKLMCGWNKGVNWYRTWWSVLIQCWQSDRDSNLRHSARHRPGGNALTSWAMSTARSNFKCYYGHALKCLFFNC